MSTIFESTGQTEPSDSGKRGDKRGESGTGNLGTDGSTPVLLPTEPAGKTGERPVCPHIVRPPVFHF